MTRSASSQHRLAARTQALLRLTRWPEHVPFTLAATLLGANMAAYHADAALDGRVLTVLAANALAVTFAFMVNDIADAPDDARAPARAARNAIASGALAARTGWAASLAVAAAAQALYATLPAPAALTGGATLLLGLLYSWRPVRLKARPIVDVIAHLLMLSALLVLAGYLAFDAAPGRVWLVIAAAGLISAYGQLYNQVRDDAQDRAAGLGNTTALLGAARARIAMRVCLGAAGLLLTLTALLGLWPPWLVGMVAALAGPVLLWRRATDMRGTQALDATGRLQLGAMLAAAAAMVLWLLVNLWS
jgi:4-hydroxybenzoate polyprenyltransferase